MVTKEACVEKEVRVRDVAKDMSDNKQTLLLIPYYDVRVAIIENKEKYYL